MSLEQISYGVATFSEMFRNKFEIILIRTESWSQKIISLALYEKPQTSYKKKKLSQQKLFQKLMG